MTPRIFVVISAFLLAWPHWAEAGENKSSRLDPQLAYQAKKSGKKFQSSENGR